MNPKNQAAADRAADKAEADRKAARLQAAAEKAKEKKKVAPAEPGPPIKVRSVGGTNLVVFDHTGAETTYSTDKETLVTLNEAEAVLGDLRQGDVVEVESEGSLATEVAATRN